VLDYIIAQKGDMLMEQKHIDEMEEDSFFEEELIVDDDTEEYPVLKFNEKKKSASTETAPKPKASATATKKKEEEISIKPAKLDAKIEIPTAPKEAVKETKENKEEIKITPAVVAPISPSNDPDNKNSASSNEEPKKSSWWKWLILLGIILLAVFIYTHDWNNTNNENQVTNNPVVEVVNKTPEVTKPVANSTTETQKPTTNTPMTPTSIAAYNLEAKKWMFDPNTITVKQGAKVTLTINPVGMDLTFAIPEFKVEKRVTGETQVEFVAEKSGTYQFTCSDCEEYRGMTGTIVVK